MSEEKEELEHIKKRVEFVTKNIMGTNVFTTYDTHCVNTLISIIENQQKELNNLKEIEKSHQEENGKLRVEFEKVYEDNLTLANELKQEKEKNKVLEAKRIWNKGRIEKLKKELEEEKEKNKDLQKQLNGAFDRGFIPKDKIKEKMEQTKKVYDEEMKPYMIEVGNGEKVLNVTYLSKKEKEELINKRNCLLVQIKTYEMLLEEK